MTIKNFITGEREMVDRVKGFWLRKVWLLAISVFILAACGGGGGDAATPTPAGVDTSVADAAAAKVIADAAAAKAASDAAAAAAAAKAASDAAAAAAATAAAAKFKIGLTVPKKMNVVRVKENI